MMAAVSQALRAAAARLLQAEAALQSASAQYGAQPAESAGQPGPELGQRSGPVQLSILSVLVATALVMFALAMSVYLSLGLHSPLLISTVRQVAQNLGLVYMVKSGWLIPVAQSARESVGIAVQLRALLDLLPGLSYPALLQSSNSSSSSFLQLPVLQLWLRSVVMSPQIKTRAVPTQQYPLL